MEPITGFNEAGAASPRKWGEVDHDGGGGHVLQ